MRLNKYVFIIIIESQIVFSTVIRIQPYIHLHSNFRGIFIFKLKLIVDSRRNNRFEIIEVIFIVMFVKVLFNN